MAENPHELPLRSDKDHSINEVWTVVRRQSESIAEIRQGQTALAQAIQDLRTDLRSIRDYATREKQPVNWIGLGVLALGVLAAGAQYADSRLTPVQARTDQNFAWITKRSEALIADYKDFGIVAENARHAHDSAEVLTERVRELNRETARMEATIDYMQQHLRDVDFGKSRGWLRDTSGSGP